MYDVNKWKELYTPHTDYEKRQHRVISLPEKSAKPLKKYMERVFERDAFQASLTEDELEMNE